MSKVLVTLVLTFAVLMIGHQPAQPAPEITKEMITPCGDPKASADQKIAACTLIIQSGAISGHALAITYHQRGEGYREKGQDDLAIADETAALRIDSNYVYAYVGRGYSYELRGQYDLAIADETAALRIDPSFAFAYTTRAEAYTNLFKYSEAVADSTAALAIDPKNARAYNDRGFANRHLLKYSEAFADFTRSLEIDPKNVYAYYTRAYLYHILGQKPRAISDYSRVIQLEGWKGHYSTYSAIREYLAYEEGHDSAKASALLRTCLRSCAHDWPYPIVQYFAKAMSRKGLLSHAGSDVGKATEVHAYLGMSELAAGRSADARTDLSWVLKNGVHRFVEYDLAKSTIRRL